MNLAVHGLSGDIRQANSYYDDLHDARRPVRLRDGQSAVQRGQGRQGRSSKDDPRFPFGLPQAPTTATTSGFSSSTRALNEHGPRRLRHGELGRRRPRARSWRSASKLIEAGAVDVMVAVGPNFFYTVTLPVHALVPRPGQGAARRARTRCCSSTPATSSARSTAPTATSRPSRSSSSPTSSGSTGARSRRPTTGSDEPARTSDFPDGTYADVPGLCKVATLDRDRGAGLEPQPWPLRRRGRAGRRRLRLRRAAGGAERGVGGAERRGARAGRTYQRECRGPAGGGMMRLEFVDKLWIKMRKCQR